MVCKCKTSVILGSQMLWQMNFISSHTIFIPYYLGCIKIKRLHKNIRKNEGDIIFFRLYSQLL